MCNCIAEMNAKLASRNTRLSEAIMFSPQGSSLMIETELIAKKRGGRPVIAFPSFCPFCGTSIAPTPEPAKPEGEL